MPAPPDSFVWTEPFRVRAYEVGPDERARVLALCDYVQEAAGEHAASAGVETFALADGPGTWILSRLRFEIAGRPPMRSRVRVVTWPAAQDGLRAERDFELRDDADAVLMRGTSTWVVMSVARRRPVRLPDAISTFGPADRPRALPPPDAEPSAPETVTAEARFTVRTSDLDRVGHANNVRFAEWALEAAERLSPGTLAGLDLAFRAEAVAGDVVVSTVGPGDAPGRCAHRLARDSDDRTLALATSIWT
jgi:acyl-ACP thioesterase